MAESEIRSKLTHLAHRFHNVPRLIRIPLGILCLLGSTLFFLPVLGLWMAPLGFLLIAEDFDWAHNAFEWIITKLEWMERRWKKVTTSESHEND